ncbi:diaminobutyrate-2-oxoglutarate transaminase [Isoptericola sp. CG 20/1183]|uniref:Diaminobutyrate--2-oxoglutarate transaminase n=1 Tax=Isoptericola halotolerans TaxID=300560 RepID=A0ABX5EDB5_9MICO|nr:MULTISPECIES: aspartate aminotransferase family protein [Isoptericola]MCK0117708.1 aspartate aminotransferase family protein [Isoptericola sp. S6320L]PRZ05123.1 diaminobutyrate-2-oxoglutarate transaminase [Isoptericola halotolerans]PRZ05861.1 diaminobutyrate-2-oxoglutarate transaminase [Isoptericola sp. CG 20/1183]
MEAFEKWESEIRGYSRTYPTVFASASNARQVDEAGRSYVDFFAGAGVLNFGHNNPRMKRAMIEFLEADGVAHSLDMATTTKRDFIEKFAETVLAPRDMTMKMQFMGPTGTNAVEAALKLARRVTGRRDVVAFTHGFHGMTLGALAATANDYFRNAAGVPLDNVVRLPFDTAPGGGVRAIEDFRALLADASSGFVPPAAFLVETIQAEGGVNVASAEWLRAVQDLAHEVGALFIIDDIQVGCGRTGSYFSFDGMGLDPDIICLAKGIGGFGTPLAMNLAKPEHDAHWSPGEHTGTFRGQGLSFVAGREALTYFDDDALMDEVRAKGETMARSLRSLADDVDAGLDVRGRGMVQGLDVGDGARGKAVVADCFASGMLIGACGSGGRVLKLIPPLTIPEEDLEEGLQILDKAVRRAI